MTAKELCQALGIDDAKLRGWLRDGLPCSRGPGNRRTFDPGAVREWLVVTGRAVAGDVEPTKVVRKIGDVAQHFGVTNRQVGYWKDEGMPWAPKRYDLVEIAEWLESKDQKARGGDPRRNELQTERVSLDVERRRLELSRMRGNLVDAAEVARLLESLVREARAQLDELHAALAALVPEDQPAEVREALREVIAARVQAFYETLSELTKPLT